MRKYTRYVPLILEELTAKFSNIFNCTRKPKVKGNHKFRRIKDFCAAEKGNSKLQIDCISCALEASTICLLLLREETVVKRCFIQLFI